MNKNKISLKLNKTYILIMVALHICRFHIHGLNQNILPERKKKIPESSKKQNLNLPQIGNYLRSI